MSLCGSCEDVLPRVEAACRNERMEAAAAELKAITEELAGAGGSIRLDMTLAGEIEYYFFFVNINSFAKKKQKRR